MKISILISFIFLSSFALQAQNRKYHSPEFIATGKANILKSMLKLTNEQTETVIQIYVDQVNSRDSLMRVIKKQARNQQAVITAWTTMLNETEVEADKKISPILDNDQKLAFSKLVRTVKLGSATSIATPVPRK